VTNRTTPPRVWAPHLALVVVQVLFGTWPIFGKLALRSISSTSLVGFRICGAAVIFTLLQRKFADLWRLPKKIILWLVVTSVLGVALNQLLFVKGLSYTTAINATLLSTTIPVFTLIISIALGYDHASFRHAIGVMLAIAGVVYLVDPFRASFSAANTLGNLLIVANSFCYGAYIAVSRDLVKKYGALDVITWVFVLGAVMTLPLAGYSWHSENWSAVPTAAWIAIGYIVLVPTVGVYYLNAWALTKLSPAIVAVYIYLQPLMAFGLAPAVLGERINSRTLVAGLLIFGGVAVVTIRKVNEPLPYTS
jgi:drug/metabolite transporter (DMT)-like permease